jgi:hypothetical protein
LGTWCADRLEVEGIGVPAPVIRLRRPIELAQLQLRNAAIIGHLSGKLGVSTSEPWSADA